MTKLILIRHGETDYNLHNRYCGVSDPSLNKKGILQAERLKKRLRKIGVHKVYSSDLKRAVETAEIVFKKIPIEKTVHFREMNFGAFEGLTHEEIIKKYAKVYKKWIRNPLRAGTPKGEGLKDVASRVRKKIKNIISENKGETIALVAHYGSIRVILCDILKKDLNMLWEIKQENGAMSIIKYYDDGMAEPLLINETSHLNGI